MAENTEKLLTIRILETPAGRDVFNAFIASLIETMDLQRSIDRARELAEGYGVWVPLQISAVIDVLTTLGPLITGSKGAQLKLEKLYHIRVSGILGRKPMDNLGYVPMGLLKLLEAYLKVQPNAMPKS